MKILFQGDSITDVGRNCSNGSMQDLGQGYAMLIAGKYGYSEPGQYEFINKGISGNRIVDVYARIKADAWNLAPDVFSILIGVNDVWHELGAKNGVDAKRYEAVYDMLISDTINYLGEVKFMLLEPFVLHGTGTDENWDYFNSEVKKRSEAVERLSKKHNAIFVPLQKKFDDACKICPPSYWAKDGVHPTPAGHQLIAECWSEAFDKYIK